MLTGLDAVEAVYCMSFIFSTYVYSIRSLSSLCQARRVQVQLDSITSNELGDPSAIMSMPGRPDINVLQGWEANPKLGAT